MRSADTILEGVRQRGFLVALGLHVVLAAVLATIPLFDVLGFERAFATGLLASITSPFVAIGLIRRSRERSTAMELGRVAGRALGLNGLTLLPTVLAGVAVERLTAPCAAQEGLLFLALCAGGNVIFGTALGIAAALVGTRRFVAPALVVAVLLSFLGFALHRLYAEPQIFVYSTPFGFWPGSLYDEALSVTTTLWAFRGYTALLAVTILACLEPFYQPETLSLSWTRTRPAGVLLALGLVACSYFVSGLGARAGFALDRETILDQLRRTVVTEHFEIHVDPSVTKEQLKRLVEDHELRYAQLTEFFGRHPETRVRSMVYRDAEQKSRLMGAGRTQIARPWAREIHIHEITYPHGILKHELAHVFAAEMAQGPFNVPTTAWVLVNIGVVEGVAVAADWPARGLTVHGWTRAMKSLGLMPDLRRMLGPTGFWSISSARAYTVAGSFIRYLIDRYGKERFATLYATNSFEAAYGRPLDALVTEWEAFLDALPLPEDELLRAEHRFKQPGIFQKVCAHEAANMMERGTERIASGDLEGGIEDLERVASWSINDPAPLLQIGDALARAGELDRATEYAERALRTKGATERSTTEAREVLAGIWWRRGRLDQAREAYASVLKRHLSDDWDRLQIARMRAIDRPPDVRDVLVQYLLGDLAIPRAVVRVGNAARAHPDDALLRYLYGRLLEAVETDEEARVELEAALALGLSDASLVREARLAHARVLLRLGAFQEARGMLRELAGTTTSTAFRLEVLDWADRASFLERGGGRAAIRAGDRPSEE